LIKGGEVVFEKRIKELEEALFKTNISDYQINSFDGNTLVMVGSFDLTYYYEIKLTFKEVDYVNCPSYFDTDRIRLATTEERQKYKKQCQLDHSDYMVVFDVDVLDTFYFIVCMDFEFEKGD
jgi:hypothetical protein